MKTHVGLNIHKKCPPQRHKISLKCFLTNKQFVSRCMNSDVKFSALQSDCLLTFVTVLGLKYRAEPERERKRA